MKWYEHFFEGLAADVWRGSVPVEQTDAEVDFLVHVLKLSEGDHVLDVPCAYGRLADPLARKGIKVTGVDLSQSALNSACGMPQAKAPYTAPTYVHADMRKLEWKDEFAGAFCMGNSFGYFDREDSMQFLRGVFRSLKPGAGFILETNLTAETFFTVGGSHEWVEVDGVYMLMECKYDPRHSRLHSKFIFLSGAMSEEHHTQHFIFTAGQICRMCEEAGFTIKRLLGSTSFNDEFALGSERLILHAVKPE